LKKDHGYCFEVSANASGLTKAVPLTAMGRFNHEAAAVDPATGIIYLTEDRVDGLFYRFIPRESGKLQQGGKLQALALGVKGRSVSTANQGKPVLPLNADMGVHWVDIVDVESPRDNLRYQGAAVGAATFARGEGMLVDSSPVKGQPNSIWIMCTVGGREGLGQIFRYQPSRYEGSSREQEKPGVLSLFSEPNDAKLLQNGDNLAVMPNGDILVCEDHQGIQRLIGVNRQGEYYVLAANPRRASEFTGATFSPDGSILFVNLQQQGGTLAIRGPWHKQTKS
jgi:secreted PhoX family phosphatase